MHTFKKISELRFQIRNLRKKDYSIGFVPTMGAIHEGHKSLVKNAVQENDYTVCSIFINPIQFDRKEDYENYPVLTEKDREILENCGCDAVLIPSAEEMYPEDPVLSFDFGYLDKVLEGKFRKGHFNGVAIVVSKLFNIVTPDRAYFGQKDIQQFKIIERLIKDLSFDIDLKYCKTVRESDGLALSSRNLRLNYSERKQAPALYQMLLKAEKLINEGESDAESVKDQARNFLAKYHDFNLEYIEILDFETFKPLESITNKAKIVICTAAYLGKIRLIDNIIINNI